MPASPQRGGEQRRMKMPRSHKIGRRLAPTLQPPEHSPAHLGCRTFGHLVEQLVRLCEQAESLDTAFQKPCPYTTWEGGEEAGDLQGSMSLGCLRWVPNQHHFVGVSRWGRRAIRARCGVPR